MRSIAFSTGSFDCFASVARLTRLSCSWHVKDSIGEATELLSGRGRLKYGTSQKDDFRNDRSCDRIPVSSSKKREKIGPRRRRTQIAPPTRQPRRTVLSSMHAQTLDHLPQFYLCRRTDTIGGVRAQTEPFVGRQKRFRTSARGGPIVGAPPLQLKHVPAHCADQFPFYR